MEYITVEVDYEYNSSMAPLRLSIEMAWQSTACRCKCFAKRDGHPKFLMKF